MATITNRKPEPGVLDRRNIWFHNTSLLPRFKVQQTEPLFCLPQVACVEGCFKAKYAAHQYPIGRATEYFTFEDLAPVQAEVAALSQLIKAESQLPSRGPNLPAAGSATQSRFQAVFERYDRRRNEFAYSGWEPVVLLVDITHLVTGERFADWQWFTLEKQFEWLGWLQKGAVLAFNAKIEGEQLKRPTQVIKVEVASQKP